MNAPAARLAIGSAASGTGHGRLVRASLAFAHEIRWDWSNKKVCLFSTYHSFSEFFWGTILVFEFDFKLNQDNPPNTWRMVAKPLPNESWKLKGTYVKPPSNLILKQCQKHMDLSLWISTFEHHWTTQQFIPEPFDLFPDWRTHVALTTFAKEDRSHGLAVQDLDSEHGICLWKTSVISYWNS